MKRMSPCTPGLSITELTRSQLLCKWNPRLSITWRQKQINTHMNSSRFLLGGRYVPKNAESLSIKNKTLYGYTIMPSWVHLQTQIGKFLKEGLHFPRRKVRSCQIDWFHPMKTCGEIKVKRVWAARLHCRSTVQQVYFWRTFFSAYNIRTLYALWRKLSTAFTAFKHNFEYFQFMLLYASTPQHFRGK